MTHSVEERLLALETAHEKLMLISEHAEVRYKTLLAMVSESVMSSATAAGKAQSAAEKSLLAGIQAAAAVKEASLVGALKVAETALVAARAAADAAGDASLAAMEAWKSALVIAGHDANPKDLRLSTDAHKASAAATEAAIKALAVFTDAFEALKEAALS